MNLPEVFITKDGRKVAIRRLNAADAALLVDLYSRLSEKTKRLRFHAYSPNYTEEQFYQWAEKMVTLDPDRQAAVVALVQEAGVERAVGVARFGRVAPAATEAEAAVVVRDDYQGIGIGKRIMQHLGYIAVTQGITMFDAWVMTQNSTVLQIVTNFGFPVFLDSEQGETHVKIYLE